MSDEHYTFELEDADDNPHEYTVRRPHRPIENASQWWGGVKLLQTVARAAGEPIMEMLSSNVGQLIETFMEGRGGEDLEGLETFDELLDRIDTSDLSELDLELPQAWNAFLDAVERVDSDELFKQLLHHTSRDAIPLSKEKNFNQAYERNYEEMLRAAFEVARYNRFFGRLATSAERQETG